MCEKDYINIQTGEKLDLEKIELLPDNAMLKIEPSLWVEWNFEKNSELGFDIWKVTKGLHKKSWWKCVNCDSDYFMSISSRTSKKSNCHFCTGHKVNNTNCLTNKNPKLASEWHPTKNDRSAESVGVGSSFKAWWLGKCGHEWKAVVSNRNLGNGCPYCCNNRKKVLKGFNDMWTTRPDTASLLVNPELGYKYTKYSTFKTDWKCPHCQSIVYNKSIEKVSSYGVSCPHCRNGKSYGERLISNILKQLGLKFESERGFNWIPNKRYDFYIESLSMIIEVHGIQHYKERTKRTRSLKEEQENDIYKYEMAKNNGIKNYIIINASVSDYDYIMNNVYNSELIKFINIEGLDEEKLKIDSDKSLVAIACNIFNEGKSLEEISEELNVSTHTVRNYLIKGEKSGLTKYKSNIAMHKKVAQYDLEGKLIKIWDNVSQACKSLNIDRSNICRCISGKTKSSHGFKWERIN